MPRLYLFSVHDLNTGGFSDAVSSVIRGKSVVETDLTGNWKGKATGSI